jgi:hypothetical protein
MSFGMILCFREGGGEKKRDSWVGGLCGSEGSVGVVGLCKSFGAFCLLCRIWGALVGFHTRCNLFSLVWGCALRSGALSEYCFVCCRTTHQKL